MLRIFYFYQLQIGVGQIEQRANISQYIYQPSTSVIIFQHSIQNYKNPKKMLKPKDPNPHPHTHTHAHPHPHHATKPQKSNQFKALYQIVKHRKDQNKRSINCIQENGRNGDHGRIVDKLKTEVSRVVDDSLDDCKEGEYGGNRGHGDGGEGKRRRWSHSRSQSCPFMNLPVGCVRAENKVDKHVVINTKQVALNESKRTLKKISTMHKKNNRNIQHKHSISQCSQVSQSSNTVIVHSLPIQHLSSMLYSLNHEKPATSNPQNKSSKQQNFKKAPSKVQHAFSIHTDLYFQTKLQQQIKMYDLNEELRKLHRETENVKIKQHILEKLAAKFDVNQEQASMEDSLLIH